MPRPRVAHRSGDTDPTETFAAKFCCDAQPAPFANVITSTRPKVSAGAKPMKRRKFIALLGGATAWPLAARAQQAAGKLPTIGSIQTFQNENTEAFSQGLREAGYVDGQNMRLETRYHRGALDQIDKFAGELVALKCSVIFAAAPYAIRAVLERTSTIPIVGWPRSRRRPEKIPTNLD
jgi:hypothetical protein